MNIEEERKKIISSLTAARLEKNLSQEALARLVGTKRSNISRMESGLQNISLDSFLKIVSALGKEAHLTLTEPAPEQTGRYSLRLYDEELLTFSMEDGGLAGLRTSLLSVKMDRADLFPPDLELTDEGVLRWLQHRVIPKNRAFVHEILQTLGLNINDTKGIIDVCKGLSLNDSYWIVPEGFDGRFADFNLFENRFSQALSLVAYTGAGTGKAAFSTSPELTTDGMLRKAWRLIEGKGIYLYKGGSEGFANAGMEPYSEFYASQIAGQMNLHAVSYDLERWKGILASTCKLFTDIDTSFIPIGRIIRTGGIPACLAYYRQISPEAEEELRSMLVFDAVIYNEDRHFGNFGVLRNNHTGKVIGAAPIFDNGLSLFNYGMEDDFRNLREYAKTRSNPYRIPYENICRELMGPKQRAQLRRLAHFTFRRHPSINLPEARLQAIEEQISFRVRELLSLPRK